MCTGEGTGEYDGGEEMLMECEESSESFTTSSHRS